MIPIITTEHQIVLSLSVEVVLFGYFGFSACIGVIVGAALSLKDIVVGFREEAYHALAVALAFFGAVLSVAVGVSLYENGGTVGDWLFNFLGLAFSVYVMGFSRSWFDTVVIPS